MITLSTRVSGEPGPAEDEGTSALTVSVGLPIRPRKPSP